MNLELSGEAFARDIKVSVIDREVVIQASETFRMLSLTLNLVSISLVCISKTQENIIHVHSVQIQALPKTQK